MNGLSRHPRRSNFPFAGLWVAAAAIGSLWSAAPVAAAGAQITALQPALRSGDALHLRIEDSWPNACTPELSSVEVRGRDIWVLARDTSARRVCGQVVSSYVIDTGSQLNVRSALVEPGVQRIHYAIDSDDGLRLRGFELLSMGTSAAPASAPENGYWWADPQDEERYAGPGIGLNLEHQGEALSLVLFGYDAEGRPDWSIASGELGQNTASLSLSRLSNGSGPRGVYQRPQGVESLGRVLVEYEGPAKATFWLVYSEAEGIDLVLRPLPMVRFSFAQSTAETWLGQWLLVLPGEVDSRPETHSFELSQLRPTTSGFALTDGKGKVELLCVAEDQTTDRLPDLCQLRIADQAIELDFDRLGLARLDGTDTEGKRVRLLQIAAD
ncbi:hypothetical protein [Aquimonas sp.]|jgi:hypothetical protein|uniref:hypothetical protein n=1 Tax=Aquimonas sp. TaxID=1872588 RepID=UPI0037C02DB4